MIYAGALGESNLYTVRKLGTMENLPITGCFSPTTLWIPLLRLRHVHSSCAPPEWFSGFLGKFLPTVTSCQGFSRGMRWQWWTMDTCIMIDGRTGYWARLFSCTVPWTYLSMMPGIALALWLLVLLVEKTGMIGRRTVYEAPTLRHGYAAQ